jgi:hypothetical protein
MTATIGYVRNVLTTSEVILAGWLRLRLNKHDIAKEALQNQILTVSA